MRLSLPIVAQHQCEDALLETINDDQRVHSVVLIAWRHASDGHLVLLGEVDGRLVLEPGATLH